MKSLRGEDVVNQALNLLISRDIEKDGDADRCSGTTSMVETLIGGGSDNLLAKKMMRTRMWLSATVERRQFEEILLEKAVVAKYRASQIWSRMLLLVTNRRIFGPLLALISQFYVPVAQMR